MRELRGAPLPLERAPEPPAPPLDTLLEARLALRQVAALRPVRRRVFERHLAGLNYREIEAELGVTYTNVNRQVTESRAELRVAAYPDRDATDRASPSRPGARHPGGIARRVE